MPSITETLLAAGRRTHSIVSGESVTLRNRNGVDTIVVTDAVCSMNSPGVSINNGKADYSGVVRLSSDHHAAAVVANVINVRGNDWHILSVGDVFAESFRIEIAREDQDHSNMFDINDQQAIWST